VPNLVFIWIEHLHLIGVWLGVNPKIWYQNDVSWEKNSTTCSQFVNHSRHKTQHYWGGVGGMYGHLIKQIIFTLTMNKIFIQAPNITTKVVMVRTWICKERERKFTLIMTSSLYVNPRWSYQLSMVLCFITFEKWVHRKNVRLRPTYLTSLAHGKCQIILNIKDPLASWGATSLTMDAWECSSSNCGILHGHQLSQMLDASQNIIRQKTKLTNLGLEITMFLVFCPCGWDAAFYWNTLLGRGMF
jgi:hypothetical protein